MSTQLRPLFLVVGTGLLLGLAAGCRPADGGETTAEAPEVGRWSLKTVNRRAAPPLLLRVDSATGEVWSMGLMEGGPWKLTPEKPGGEPEAGTVPGRYGVKSVKPRRGPPNLLRVDNVTGRVWRKGAGSGGPWVPIETPAN